MVPLLSVFNLQAQAARGLSLRSGSQLEAERRQAYQLVDVSSVAT
jgi:hypothetical protein